MKGVLVHTETGRLCVFVLFCFGVLLQFLFDNELLIRFVILRWFYAFNVGILTSTTLVPELDFAFLLPLIHNCLNGSVTAAVVHRWDCGQLSFQTCWLHRSSEHEWAAQTSPPCKNSFSRRLGAAARSPPPKLLPERIAVLSSRFTSSDSNCCVAQNWSSRRWIIHSSHEGDTSWILFANTAILAKFHLNLRTK